jgi:hypothetical protein
MAERVTTDEQSGTLAVNGWVFIPPYSCYTDPNPEYAELWRKGMTKVWLYTARPPHGEGNLHDLAEFASITAFREEKVHASTTRRR